MKIAARLAMLVSIILSTLSSYGESTTASPEDVIVIQRTAQLATHPRTTDLNREFFVGHIMQTLSMLSPDDKISLLDSVLEALNQSEQDADVKLFGSEVIGAACLIGMAYLAMKSAKRQFSWRTTLTVTGVSAAALSSVIFAQKDAGKLRRYIKSVREPLLELRESFVLNQKVEQLR